MIGPVLYVLNIGAVACPPDVFLRREGSVDPLVIFDAELGVGIVREDQAYFNAKWLLGAGFRHLTAFA